MRCPKCHYVSFDGQPRCRNCGYDLSLSPPTDFPDLSTRPGSPAATTLADLSLRPEPEAPASGSTSDSGSVSPPAAGSVAGGSGAGGRAPLAGSVAAGALGGETSGSSDTGRVKTDRMNVSAGAAGGSGTATGRVRSSQERGGYDRGGQEVDPLDLPLFDPGPLASGGIGSSSVDRPLIAPNTPPRPPLAVRRPTDTPRARARVTPAPTPRLDEPTLDLDLPDRLPEPDLLLDDTPTSGTGRVGNLSLGHDRATGTGSSQTGTITGPLSSPLTRGRDRSGDRDRDFGAAAGAIDEAASAIGEDGDGRTAPLQARAIAALLDLAFLAIIDVTVLHFTLRLTGVPADDLSRLPLAPLVGFLALLNGGYLTMFTAASGQTMGKMVTGVKVVSLSHDPAAAGGVALGDAAGDHEAVPFGNAVLRSILWLLTIVPAGIGALPALLGDDRRALHDRLANTRVIKVE